MYYPDLKLSDEEKEVTLGKFGLLYQEYLKENRIGTYTHLLTSGKMSQHLAEIDREAQKRCESISSYGEESGHYRGFQGGKSSYMDEYSCSSRGNRST